MVTESVRRTALGMEPIQNVVSAAPVAMHSIYTMGTVVFMDIYKLFDVIVQAN